MNSLQFSEVSTGPGSQAAVPGVTRRRAVAVMGAGAVVAAAGLAVPSGATAQTPAWPTKPVRIVHGFAPGGPVDAMARLLAAHFADAFGQQALVEGKPGAGGTLGAAQVARAEPDGHTLYLMASGHAAAPGLYKSLPYDPVRDFTMVTMLSSSPFVIVAGANSPITSVQDLVAKARAQPGRIDYGSGGNGSGMHLTAVLMQARGSFRLSHVPYKGGSAPLLAVMAGEVPVIFSSLAGMAPQVQTGKVRLLAVTSRQRFGLYPDVPTVAETVVPDLDVSAWYALAAPKGLPAPLVERLNRFAHQTLQASAVAESLRAQASTVWLTTPAQAQAFLEEDVARWRRLIQDEKITAGD